MKRGGFLSRTTPLRRSAMKRKRAAYFSGIRPEQRDAVNLRDRGICARCGVWTANVGGEQHHRLLRSRGGTDALSCLILLCAPCHRDVHLLVADATDDGFICRTGENPPDVPVMTWEGWRFYGDDGSVLTRSQFEGSAS